MSHRENTDVWQAPEPPAAPRKRRRYHVGMWLFLAVQVIFVIWIVSSGTTIDHSVTHCTGQSCKGISESAGGVAIGLIVLFWAVVDVILGFIYLVVHLARRPRAS